MARKSSVRYWESRKAYCCWWKGHQETLAEGPKDEPDGPTYSAAREAFRRLERGAIFGPTVAEVAEQYLVWHRGQHRAASTRPRADRLRQVCKALGGKYACELTGPAIETWAAEQRQQCGWADGTVRLTLSTLRACLRWAVRAKLLKEHPADDLHMPQETSRGMEVVLEPDQEARVMRVARGAVRDLAAMLRDTGCRPGEAAAVEARHYDPGLKAFVLPASDSGGGPTHKTSRSGKARVIFLSGESLGMVERLRERHPTGPLLRTPAVKRSGPQKGKRWAWEGPAIRHAFRQLRKRAGVPGLVPYSFRHTYAVRWLRSGGSIAVLAKVLGTSIRMIERHYGHLGEQSHFLRSEVDAIRGKPAG